MSYGSLPLMTNQIAPSLVEHRLQGEPAGCERSDFVLGSLCEGAMILCGHLANRQYPCSLWAAVVRGDLCGEGATG